MLTRTPEQMTLTETSRLCQQIVDLCSDAADRSADGAVKELMLALAEEHKRLRARVDARLRALDDFPLSPDPDLELVKMIATRAKQIFAQDEDSVVLDERIAGEQELISHVAEARKLDLSADTHACLEEVGATAARALAALEKARAAHDVP